MRSKRQLVAAGAGRSGLFTRFPGVERLDRLPPFPPRFSRSFPSIAPKRAACFGGSADTRSPDTEAGQREDEVRRVEREQDAGVDAAETAASCEQRAECGRRDECCRQVYVACGGVERKRLHQGDSRPR
jgi:hypothetical protein